MAKKTRAERKKEKQRASNIQGTNLGTTQDDSKVDESSDVADEQESEAGDETAEDSDSSDSSVKMEKESEKAPSKEEVKAAAKAAKAKRKRQERERKAELKRNKPRRGPKFIWSFIDYLSNVKMEMKRVVWPTRKDVLKMTIIVLIALIFFGIIIYAVDFAITPLLVWFSEIGG